jgi:Na+/melibiose symporter-like transporter
MAAVLVSLVLIGGSYVIKERMDVDLREKRSELSNNDDADIILHNRAVRLHYVANLFLYLGVIVGTLTVVRLTLILIRS